MEKCFFIPLGNIPIGIITQGLNNNNTTNQANEEVVEITKDHLLETNALFYQEIVDQLSNTQIEMINAAIDKVTQFSSSDVMRKYKLGTPNNISKNKVVLENKDIIEFGGESPRFVDPFFKLWFINHQRVL